MKNVFKTGFLALALSLSLTSCHWFSKSDVTTPIDSNKIDSPKIDSPKIDSQTIDSPKTNPDSDKIKH